MTSSLLDLILGIPSSATATNFYLDSSDVNSPFQTRAAERRDRLGAHLDDVQGGDLVIVGEAAGWRGARQSGVAFTSPVMVGLPGTREPSATTVHDVLATHGLHQRTLLWNAFPLHPHTREKLNSNREPTAGELTTGRDLLRVAVTGRRVLCVGGNAAKSVGRVLGIWVPTVDVVTSSAPAVALRHPAYGGVPEFRAGFQEIVTRWGL